jgi:hypothetical protein
VYEQKKKENLATYGKQSGCASLSAMIRTVVQQKKSALKNFINN